MKYLALYRKYRPSKFEELVGQNNVVSVIRNAIINNKVSHAYLFYGPRGTGKTTTAKLLAKMVNCDNLVDGNPCGKCRCCLETVISDDVVEIDAASNNGVDEIRELKDKINFVPSSFKYKIYIIDEVHMLSTGAFNALLKTLEEPPKHVIFILATTEYYKIPLTISSRCQKFRFEKICIDDIVNKLLEICKLEGIKIDLDVLKEIAKISDGGLRDAINLLDQLIAYKGNDIKLVDLYDISEIVSFDIISELLIYISQGKIEDVVNLIEENDKKGKNISKFIEEIVFLLRDVLIFSNTNKINDLNGEKKEILTEISNYYDDEVIYYFIEELNNLLNEIRTSMFPLILFEICVIKLINKYFNNDLHIQNKSVKLEEKISEIVVDNDIIKDDIIDEDDNKEVLNVQVKNENKKIKVNIVDDNIIKLKKIRINNTFYDANKSYLLEIKDKWKDIFEYIDDDNFSMIISLLKDVEVVVAGSMNIILSSKYSFVCVKLNNCLSGVESLLFKLYEKKILPIFLNNDEWEVEKKKYINNLKNKYVYHYMEECSVEEKKDDEKNDNSISNELESIFGKEFIEYK